VKDIDQIAADQPGDVTDKQMLELAKRRKPDARGEIVEH
jgi:hypothetical protein